MWIVSNNSYISVVENRNNRDYFVVRARIKGDLENFFAGEKIEVHETSDSDYRFRTFVKKTDFITQMSENINKINYTNFKDSVKEIDRKSWYTKIWYIMYDVQERLYQTKAEWLNYYDKKF